MHTTRKLVTELKPGDIFIQGNGKPALVRSEPHDDAVTQRFNQVTGEVEYLTQPGMTLGEVTYFASRSYRGGDIAQGLYGACRHVRRPSNSTVEVLS